MTKELIKKSKNIRLWIIECPDDGTYYKVEIRCCLGFWYSATDNDGIFYNREESIKYYNRINRIESKKN